MKSTTEPTSFPPNYQHYNCYALSSSSLQKKRPKFSNFPEKKRKFSTQVFLRRSEIFRFLRNKGLVLSTLPSPGRAGGRRSGQRGWRREDKWLRRSSEHSSFWLDYSSPLLQTHLCNIVDDFSTFIPINYFMVNCTRANSLSCPYLLA